jgi:ATP-binding cassette, subfamily B, bacterial
VDRRNLFKFILAMCRPFKTQIWGFVIISLGWAASVNLQALFIKYILDAAVGGENRFADLSFWSMCYLGLGFLLVLLFFFYDLFLLNFEPAQKKRTSLFLLDHLLEQNASFYQQYSSGNLSNKVNDLVSRIPELVNTITDDLLNGFCLVAIALINIGAINTNIAVLVFVWLVVFLGSALLISARYRHLVGKSAESRALVTGHMIDMMLNISNIRLFVRKKLELLGFKKITSQALNQEKELGWFITKTNLFQGASFVILQTVTFWILYQGLKCCTITPGDFVLILMLVRQIFSQFWSISKRLRSFWIQIGTMEQAFSVTNRPIEIPDHPQAKDLVIQEGKITFDQVHFLYAQEEPLFENNNVVISGHQHVGLVGCSGSGKSTFISLILRLFDIQSGRILIDDQDIRMVTQKSLRESISVIPQEPILFQRNLMDNIRYGRPEASDEEVIEVAKKAMVHDFIQHFPEGYETMAGERGVRLSGGQRQRIAIARAILKNAPILILDEATSQLDSITESKIQESLFELMAGRTTLIIAHRLSTLSRVDRILVFDRGNIVQDGAHKELIQQKGPYRTLWKYQKQDPLAPDGKQNNDHVWG